MKTISAIFVALALLANCLPAVAQNAAPELPVVVDENPPAPPPPVEEPPAVPQQPAPPPTPAPPAPRPNGAVRPTSPPAASPVVNRLREVVVGPADSKSPKKVRGKVSVVAVPPASTAIASVEVFFNSALIGQTSQKPYKVEFNTDTVSPGIHTFKAVGRSADGKQVWTASTAVEIPGAGVTASAPVKPASSASAPAGSKPTPSPNAGKPTAVATALPAPKPVAANVQSASNLQKIYASTKNGFSVRYPAGWVVSDRSSEMKPKKPGNVWIAITPNEKVPSQALNIRRMRVDPKTTADVFAKYNSYVNSWDKTTVLGSPAFATTSNVAPKKVIHRLILVKNGYAWMLNCIDATGNPEKSKQLFDSVVASFALTGKQANAAVKAPAKSTKH